MIQNKFVRFKTYAAFKAKLDAGEISKDSIVFIKDKKIIYHNGIEYNGNKQVEVTKIDELHNVSDYGMYDLMMNGSLVGQLLVFDAGNHILTQVITTHLTFVGDDENGWIFDDDNIDYNFLNNFYRSYRLTTSGKADWNPYTWSNWKPVNDWVYNMNAGLIEDLSARIDAIENRQIISTDEKEYNPTITTAITDDLYTKIEDLQKQVVDLTDKYVTAYAESQAVPVLR